MTPKNIRCRPITDADLGAVTALLSEGFSGRSMEYWNKGLERLKHRALPDGCHRYGLLLEAEGRIVGVILQISSARRIDGAEVIFTNVKSWYVKEEFRSYAQLLVSVALRHTQVTYLDISPASHTWPIVETQGYARLCSGLFCAFAPLKRKVPGVQVESVSAGVNKTEIEALPEYTMLREHAGFGCIVLICRDGGNLYPFIFRLYRIRSGRICMPGVMTIYSRERDELVQFAGTLGRFLLARGLPVIVMNADGPVAGLPGFFTTWRGRKYFKGPSRPRLCDLSYTEFAIFGL